MLPSSLVMCVSAAAADRAPQKLVRVRSLWHGILLLGQCFHIYGKRPYEAGETGNT